MVLELSSPGMEDTGKAGQVRADKALILSEPFEGLGRGLEHGLVGEALMRAEKRAQGFRDGKGHEEVRSRKLFVQVVV